MRGGRREIRGEEEPRIQEPSKVASERGVESMRLESSHFSSSSSSSLLPRVVGRIYPSIRRRSRTPASLWAGEGAHGGDNKGMTLRWTRITASRLSFSAPPPPPPPVCIQMRRSVCIGPRGSMTVADHAWRSAGVSGEKSAHTEARRSEAMMRMTMMTIVTMMAMTMMRMWITLRDNVHGDGETVRRFRHFHCGCCCIWACCMLPRTFLIAVVLSSLLSIPLEPRCWRLLCVVSEFLVRYLRLQNSHT